MDDAFLAELIAAREARKSFAVVTVAATSGSVPRTAGSKMLVYGDGRSSGTIGGGKFESLVIAETLEALRTKTPSLKTYPLREGETESFGAICGGEMTVFIEPQSTREALYLIGAGHCARAIATLAHECGLCVTVLDDRADLLSGLPPAVTRISDTTPTNFITSREWRNDEALILVSRNHEIDGEALAVAVEQNGAGYIGMIGSRRKVRMVFDRLRERGISEEKLARVFAPLGLDIGAESPKEIAVSAIAEVLAVLRGRSAKHLRAARE
ncbi:MAG TPA: XdhC family protein [Chthoniobacterales bacterium]|jgi:xanthine dehydrogenase accessory factor|nr:XdhC family protein [Chthoniobacterales bacterium]